MESVVSTEAIVFVSVLLIVISWFSSILRVEMTSLPEDSFQLRDPLLSLAKSKLQMTLLLIYPLQIGLLTSSEIEMHDLLVVILVTMMLPLEMILLSGAQKMKERAEIAAIEKLLVLSLMLYLLLSFTGLDDVQVLVAFGLLSLYFQVKSKSYSKNECLRITTTFFAMSATTFLLFKVFESVWVALIVTVFAEGLFLLISNFFLRRGVSRAISKVLTMGSVIGLLFMNIFTYLLKMTFWKNIWS